MRAHLYQVENQDTLATTRALLQDLWPTVALDHMFIPTRENGVLFPEGELIDDPVHLGRADPFAPIMPVNHAPFALQALKDQPGRRIGIFMRPCEWRTFQVMRKQAAEKRADLFSISADCTGAMSPEEFERLGEKDPHALTQRVLRFASQGGILPSRQQSSCQLCDDPIPGEVDLQFELFGVPTTNSLVLKFKDASIAQVFSEQNAGVGVTTELSERRATVLQDLARWRSSSFEKRKAKLGPEAISFEGLFAHLQTCAPCRSTLQKHCPTIDPDVFTSQDAAAGEELRRWLMSCSGCGVCDKDCPQAYPLFDVVFSLRSLI